MDERRTGDRQRRVSLEVVFVVELSNDPNLTDWITALASLGAMVGTVGAVWFALWQTRRRGQLQLHSDYAYVARDERTTTRFLAVTATHMGGPPVLVTSGYQEDCHGRRLLGGYSLTSERVTSEGLPVLLTEGQQVTVYWNAEQGERWLDASESWYRATVIMSMRGGYRALYPGVRLQRRGLLRRKRYERTHLYGA